FASSLRNLIGGRMIVYESLLDRGRREALLRMKEQAIGWGATQVVNVRLETSNIGNQTSGKGLVAIEVIAYGTAIR
ncbi:MAG: heavy metal-binding domain-containing protein, partial [Cyanobacteria bacterium J06623_1]